ncbi:hypothetical protein DFH06DRAFT_1171953 [Mycena polygramma]|nr:hypothetical protein DFH06DRAFT_1171953 [Mycena polygramma]
MYPRMNCAALAFSDHEHLCRLSVLAPPVLTYFSQNVVPTMTAEIVVILGEGQDPEPIVKVLELGRPRRNTWPQVVEDSYFDTAVIIGRDSPGESIVLKRVQDFDAERNLCRRFIVESEDDVEERIQRDTADSHWQAGGAWAVHFSGSDRIDTSRSGCVCVSLRGTEIYSSTNFIVSLIPTGALSCVRLPYTFVSAEISILSRPL